jgi:deoxycytidylate deaminase/dephospho-CoA kinase
MSSLQSESIVLGLTGPFGSGCSTLAEILKEKYSYTSYSLSDFVKKAWLEKNPGKNIKDALREELQATGNNIRREQGLHALAEMAFKEAEKDNKIGERITFDSIRNIAEVDFLRKRFHNFFLVAVDCAENYRWLRTQELYKGNYLEFLNDDNRDKNEEGLQYGQQVALCVDDADILIRNDNDDMIRTKPAYKEGLSNRVNKYIKIFTGDLQLPNEQETFMSIAYTASLKSHCFKRQVGAVIVDPMGKVVSVGYNDNPAPLKSCIDGFYGCFKDAYIDELMKGIKFCPECGKELINLKYPYECPGCQKNICHQIIRDRAIGRCSALHAEERAILDSGRQNLMGCTLYVTAFPCFTCTQKILDMGINTIWYAESYPDADGLRAFEKAGTVSLQKFEGVKARAYFRVFPQWRARQEKIMLDRRMKQWT